MIKYKYGEFENEQFKSVKKRMQKKIFFLLLLVDPNTRESYPNVDVEQAITGVLYKFNGLNSILNYPPELVMVISSLECALNEYNKEDFDFKIYRKLLLDAGNEVMKISEGV